MSDEGFAPVLPFDTDDPEFARGFEAGVFWQSMKDQELGFQQLAHGANSEMFIRMGEAVDREVTAEILDDTWVLLYVSDKP